MKYSPLIFGLVAGIIFSIVDSAVFLYTEKKFVHYLEEHFESLDRDEIIILLSAISAAISIFIANYIEIYLSKYFMIQKFPSLDALGIIIGVFIVIGTYEYKFKH